MSARPTHRRVLCVDPNASYPRLYLRELEPRGYIVDVVATGSTALAMLGTQAFDLVCLALELPDLAGPEVLHRVHSELGLGELPIIVTTMQGSSDVLQLIGKHQNAVLLRKPFPGARLAKLVRRLIEH